MQIKPHGKDRNISGQWDLSIPVCSIRARCFARIVERTQAAFREEQGDFPEADGADCEPIRPSNAETAVSRAFFPSAASFVMNPNRHVRIEQDHLSASHSTSIGEMMSPVMNKLILEKT